jgi:hypothetical protein
MQPESEKRSEEFIPVNQILHTKPQLGPIPGEQVVAWIVIVVTTYIVCKGILSLSWVATGLVGVWGIATWWILNGDESWRYLTKFCRVPRWTLGNLPYSKLLDQTSNDSNDQISNSKEKSIRKKQSKTSLRKRRSTKSTKRQ